MILLSQDSVKAWCYATLSPYLVTEEAMDLRPDVADAYQSYRTLARRISGRPAFNYTNRRRYWRGVVLWWIAVLRKEEGTMGHRIYHFNPDAATARRVFHAFD
jgi:hypothetical protein